MSVTDALATSPNTAFAKLISQVGVQRTVDMAVKLGLRSYADPGTARDYDPESNESLADFVKRQNLGSFTLGPIEVNALELSNVAATLASGGMWCPPNPIDKVFDRNGNEVVGHHRDLRAGGARGPGQHAGQRDEQGRHRRRHRGRVGRGGRAGTCRCRARRAPPRRTGRPGFVGFTNHYAAANYIYDDSTDPGDLCSFPLRQCGDGNLYGGNEPARTWFTAMKPIATNFGDVQLPPTDPRYVDGGPGSRVPSVVGPGRGRGAAAPEGRRLPGRRPSQLGQQQPPSTATVVGTSPSGQTIPGSIITIQISNGIPPAPPPPPPDGWPAAAAGSARTVVEIPGLPPITVPVLAPPPPPPPP